MRCPPAPHPPEALNAVALGALTRPPIQAQVRIDLQDVLHTRSAVPWGILNGDHDLRTCAGRIHAGAVLEMGDKGRLEPLLCAVSRLGGAACWLLKPARRPLPRHQMQRGNTIDLILVLPGPHQRTTPLHAQGDVERRDQGKTRFILAQHPALALVGFVFTL